ncbi:YeaC family protein [Celerinatantimonas yamalensis]|uniref:DUF1315 family protein n=1 Tax=Celerinatantimonas yamalensis TaxID=559956 RepID=A0ABW9G3G1_9GAMM
MDRPIDDIEQLLAMMTPELYQRLATAVEIGRWPDGRVVSTEQRQHALQMTLIYQSRHNDDAQHMSVNRSGEIEIKSKNDLKAQYRDDSAMIARLKPEA